MIGFRRKPQQLTLPGVQVRRAGRPRVAGPRLGPIARLRRSLVAAPVTRRRFLAGTLGWITAAIAAALGIPAAAAWISPALRPQQEGWYPIGRIREPEPGEPDLSVVGEPIETQFTMLVQDAYLAAQPQEVAVWVINHGGGEFTIFDDRCTHLGCPYGYDPKARRFNCPCHDGVFDLEGRVLAGPPPRPLDRYEYKVENGVLYAGDLYRVNDRLQRITQ